MSKQRVSSHWRGLAKIGVTAVTVVIGSACVAAIAGACGALAFSLGAVELSGGAIAIGLTAGSIEGVVDYSLDAGGHHVTGYLSAAGLGAIMDAVTAGIPEEFIFGGQGQGAHSMEQNFGQSLQQLPAYLFSVFK
jgi:hypothetical protein